MNNGQSSHSPYGVPLSELEMALQSTTLRASRENDDLIVKNGELTTRVQVRAPARAETQDGMVSAVVTITTDLPAEFSKLFVKPGIANVINRMATLGAATEDKGRHFVGSRLTVYEGKDEWNEQFGLLLFSVIASADSIIGATRKMFTKESPQRAVGSAWTNADLEFMKSHLSRSCVCTTGGEALTAEFGIREGQVSVVAGDRYTALWQLATDQPHPELGDGLACILTMPHRIDSQEKLDRTLEQLNRYEMHNVDFPPHFGAWCRAHSKNNPAYVSFLPNAFHDVDGIALAMSAWARRRALLADVVLSRGTLQ